MLRVLSISLMVLVISACSSTGGVPDTHFYLLDDLPSSQPSNNQILKNAEEQVVAIQLEAIKLPDYLNQRQLVTKQNTNQLTMANYHSWADNFGDSIHRVMLRNLNELRSDTENTDTKTSSYRFSKNFRSCPCLAITITHFYPIEQGQVVLSGTVELRKEQDSTQAIVNDFLFSRELTTDGYDNAVSQMRDLLGELAMQINVLLANQQ